jgi:hypothetical protein
MKVLGEIAGVVSVRRLRSGDWSGPYACALLPELANESSGMGFDQLEEAVKESGKKQGGLGSSPKRRRSAGESVVGLGHWLLMMVRTTYMRSCPISSGSIEKKS